MDIKGLTELRECVPELRSPAGGAWIGTLATGLFSLVVIFFAFVKRSIPEWSLDGQVIILTIGFLLLRMFFSNKKSFIVRYGALAYRNAFFRFVLPGLALTFAAVAHIGFMPGPRCQICGGPHCFPIWAGTSCWLAHGCGFGLSLYLG